ncbi:MAG: right-handed parallel beta-helix repeat-containing protein, partial [Candidatus Eisenbacteria sp.]|nr:right-handed parallel beta-helix repeat-containing protein [Candidatus Eisenbacteria bacterium]
MDCTTATVTVTNCTFTGNSSANGGVLRSADLSEITVQNSIIAFSTQGCAVNSAGGLFVTLTCCNLYGNHGGDWVAGAAGQYGSNGNISLDPLFCNPESGDFHVREDSPCAPFSPPNPGCDLIGALPVGCPASSPTTFVIAPDGTGDFPTIQAAIDAADHGDVIQLADGTFSGEGNRDLDYRGKIITVRSESGNPEACIIDCEGSEQNLRRGVYFALGLWEAAVLQGVTITNGYEGDLGGAIIFDRSSPTVSNCVFFANHGARGGALHCTTASPTVRECVFRDNVAVEEGGAIYCDDLSFPVMIGCMLEGNTASIHGGGMYCSGSSPTVTDCVFHDNSADNGGGMSSKDYSCPTISNCTFTENSAQQGNGGGLYLANGSDAAVEHSSFVANESLLGVGAGIYCQDSGPTVEYTAFLDNLAPQGAAVGCQSATASFTNCTLCWNRASQGAGVWCDGSQITVENTIIAFSPFGDAIHCTGGYSAMVTCSDIYGNAGGDWVGCIDWLEGVFGNISEDPHFCGELNPLLP